MLDVMMQRRGVEWRVGLSEYFDEDEDMCKVCRIDHTSRKKKGKGKA